MIQQVRREGVSERVRRDVVAAAGALNVFVYHAADAPASET